MFLMQRQLEVKNTVEAFARLQKIPPAWAVAVAMKESSLGLRQKSPTGCLGVFQMSSIAMKDLLQVMERQDDEIVDISCGGAFLHVLLDRFKDITKATEHFCDPADKATYVPDVLAYMKVFSEGSTNV